MDKGKLKNIIIIILAVVNCFFAALVIVDAAESASYEKAAYSSLLQALENSGIKVSEETLQNTKPVPLCTFSRDLNREQRQVSSVIGASNASDQGGNIYMYYGKNGQACFRGTGEFEILMENDSVKTGSDPLPTAEDFMKKQGAELSAGSAKLKSDNGTIKVTALCSFKGRAIVNCAVDMTFSSKSLLLASGIKPLTDVKEDKSTQVIDTATTVMRLLDLLKNKGYACSEITGISHLYKMDVSAAGEGTLTPIWLFATDIGDFYINGVTGKEEIIAQIN